VLNGRHRSNDRTSVATAISLVSNSTTANSP
jgi:hypothetical protein